MKRGFESVFHFSPMSSFSPAVERLWNLCRSREATLERAGIYRLLRQRRDRF